MSAARDFIAEGRALCEANRHGEAIAAFNKAIAADPGSAEAFWLRSQSLRRLRKERGWLDDLLQCARRQGDFPGCLDQIEEAIAGLRGEIDKQSTTLRSRDAALELAAGDLENCYVVTILEPCHPTVWLFRGSSPNDAIAQYLRYEDAGTENPDGSWSMTRDGLQMTFGDVREALAHYLAADAEDGEVLSFEVCKIVPHFLPQLHAGLDWYHLFDFENEHAPPAGKPVARGVFKEWENPRKGSLVFYRPPDNAVDAVENLLDSWGYRISRQDSKAIHPPP